jgi:VCBS repeat protein/ASPIC/UnbV protein
MAEHHRASADYPLVVSTPSWPRILIGEMPEPADTLRPDAPQRPRMGRREFMRSSIGASLALALAAAWPTRMLGAVAKVTSSTPSGGQAESTRRMAALLQKIRMDADPMQNAFRNTERISLLRAALAQATDPQKKAVMMVQISDELLQAGQPMEALSEIDEMERLVQANGLPTEEQIQYKLMSFKALCHLRAGELENCCANHNADSCLFPIHGMGIHTIQRGSRGAIAVLSDLLERYPSDLKARWLLNIAYMTLGEYPDRVPPRLLLDPGLFESGYDIKHFTDVSASVGLDVTGLAGGVVLEDFDNDGFLDVMVSSWGLNKQLRLFRNNGDGTFTERTKEAGLLGEVGGLNMISCDYNNDGLMDVLVLRGAWLASEGHYPVSLLRNNGDFTFTDVTEEAGLLRLHPTGTAVWFDYNGDGWLDLFIGNETQRGDVNTCELFRNNGDGTFTECAAEHGLDVVGFVKGVASADFNNDGRPDLLISRLDGPPMLMRNDGPAGPDTSARAPWRFTDVADEAGITRPTKSFPCWFFDYNNDGLPDIFLSGYSTNDVGDVAADYLGRPCGAEKARLYKNNGDGTFADVSRECGVNKLLLTMGCNFGDLDNDGWLDFYVGTGAPDLGVLVPNRMFHNEGGERFRDVTTSGGFGQLQKGHGIAFGDINNDGTQDIYSVVGGAVEGDEFHHQLFANPGHGNNWLKLKLEGVRTNRAAIGARIKVVVQTDQGERAIHRTVGSGGSFGASPMRQEIGLGAATSVNRAEIYWPVTGETQVVRNLEINRLYHVREGDEPKLCELRSFKWPGKASA